MEISVKTIITAVILILLIVSVFVFQEELREIFTKESIIRQQIAFQSLPQVEKAKTFYLTELRRELGMIKQIVEGKELETANALAALRRRLIPPIEAPAPVEREPKEYTMRILSGTRVEPANLTIFVGDTVHFVNADNELRWPAADPFPTSSSLPDFSALGGIGVRETFSYTFFIPGTFGYHDRLLENPPTIGRITVLP